MKYITALFIQIKHLVVFEGYSVQRKCMHPHHYSSLFVIALDFYLMLFVFNYVFLMGCLTMLFLQLLIFAVVTRM